MKDTISTRKIAGINGILFFAFWLILLLAGADFPPPPGFLWIVVAVVLCAAVVYWRVPTYLAWSCSRRPGRHWRVARDGIVAGLLAALPFAAGGNSEPSMAQQPLDYAIWFAVLAVVGVFNASAIYGINALVARKMAVPSGDKP